MRSSSCDDRVNQRLKKNGNRETGWRMVRRWNVIDHEKDWGSDGSESNDHGV
jgi:hypothetical protein